MKACSGRRLVIFLGNPLFSDDGVGLILGEMLRRDLEEEGWEVEVLERAGLALMDYLEGRELVVLVDAVKAGGRIGDVIPMKPEEFQASAPLSPHYVGLPETLRLMRALGLKPPRIHILGIEVKDPYTVSEKLSEELSKRLEEIREKIYGEIKKLTISPRYQK